HPRPKHSSRLAQLRGAEFEHFNVMDAILLQGLLCCTDFCRHAFPLEQQQFTAVFDKWCCKRNELAQCSHGSSGDLIDFKSVVKLFGSSAFDLDIRELEALNLLA